MSSVNSSPTIFLVFIDKLPALALSKALFRAEMKDGMSV